MKTFEVEINFKQYTKNTQYKIQIYFTLFSSVDTQQQIKDNFNLYIKSNNYHKRKLITYKLNYKKLIKILVIKAN